MSLMTSKKFLKPKLSGTSSTELLSRTQRSWADPGYMPLYSPNMADVTAIRSFPLEGTLATNVVNQFCLFYLLPNSLRFGTAQTGEALNKNLFMFWIKKILQKVKLRIFGRTPWNVPNFRRKWLPFFRGKHIFNFCLRTAEILDRNDACVRRKSIYSAFSSVKHIEMD